jgi:hypothetical protein
MEIDFSKDHNTRAGRASLSETAEPSAQLHPVKPTTVARGKGVGPNGAMDYGDPAVSERRALPASVWVGMPDRYRTPVVPLREQKRSPAKPVLRNSTANHQVIPSDDWRSPA